MSRAPEPLPHLIPNAGPNGELLPWIIEIEDVCSECGTYCDYPQHYYTPPQSPVTLRGFTNLTNLDVSIYASAQNRNANNNNNTPDTPFYPHAPPSTPVTAQSAEHPIHFWSSDVYKTTINFPPSELPEHLRDGAWCHMPAHSELAILFGPEAATPFNWTPTASTVHDDNDSSVDNTVGAGSPKFFWGPLQLDVGADSEAASTKFHEITAANNSGSSLDSEEEVVLYSNKEKA